MSDVLVQVTDLSVDYITDSYVERALAGVSLEIVGGSITALVGESGSGKSTLANAIAGLLPSTAVIGESSGVILGGLDVVGARPGEMQALRGSFVGFVPQDPRRSLHPLKRIGDQIAESLLRHRVVPRREVDKRVEELLEKVGIDDPGLRRKQFPHQFSGGMQQRALIAIALAANPRLVVADEPTSALDVTVQKQILTLLASLARTDGVAVLLVTHDLALAANYSQQIYVMHRGLIVESGSTSEFFKRPTSQYARDLLNASPRLLVSDIEPPQEGDGQAPLLALQDVTRRIRVPAAGGRPARHFLPVDEVSFSVGRGKTVALVGESGAGKTTAARIALGLESADGGRVVFDGEVVAQLGRVAQREFRRRTQLIPQNPAVSFDPRWTVEQVIQEPLIADKTPRSELRRRTLTLLDQVGLPRIIASKRALELSGGQQQRVAIARAVSRGPELIVCDEPTSALDVTVQALIVALLRDLQEATGVSLLFVTHDLALVSEIAHDVVVMRSGRVVEAGSARGVLNTPTSAYTKELLAVVPQVPAPIVANRGLAQVH